MECIWKKREMLSLSITYKRDSLNKPSAPPNLHGRPDVTSEEVEGGGGPELLSTPPPPPQP